MIKQKMIPILVVGLGLTLTSMGCEEDELSPFNTDEEVTPAEEEVVTEETEEPMEAEPTTYSAELGEVNPDLTEGEVTGTAEMTVTGDELEIVVEAEGLPPNMAVLQHFHGFEEGTEAAACPDPAQDANEDGVVDLIETEEVAGVTMVPFTDDPVSMDITGGTYPETSEEGQLSYTQTVSLTELQDAFEEQYGTRELDLANRVVFLHGVPEDTELPDTVQSLEGVPAHVTVPVACGVLE